MNRVDLETLAKYAVPIMMRIEDKIGETVAIACIDPVSGMGEILAEVQGTSGVCIHLEKGFKVPLHIGAPFKAMLAFMPDAEVREYIEKNVFTEFTPNTIMTKEGLYACLDEIRRLGYALDNEEAVHGFNCVAVPVFDQKQYPVAGVWVTGRKVNLPLKQAGRFVKVLKEGAEQISSVVFGNATQKGGSLGYDVIAKAEKLMAEHLPSEIKMEELADSLHVGYSWFRKKFKLQTGVSPNEYYLLLKIDQVKEMLATTELTASDIAQFLNFNSSHYMSKLFKQKTGKTPIQYRSEVSRISDL